MILGARKLSLPSPPRVKVFDEIVNQVHFGMDRQFPRKIRISLSFRGHWSFVGKTSLFSVNGVIFIGLVGNPMLLYA